MYKCQTKIKFDLILCLSIYFFLFQALNATANDTLTYIHNASVTSQIFWWIRCYCCVVVSIKYSYLLQIQLLVVVLLTHRSATSRMSVTLEHAQQMLEKGEKIEQEFAEYFTGE